MRHSPWVVRRMRLVVGSLVLRPWVAVLGAAHSLEVVLGRKALGRVEARRILVAVMVRGDIRREVEGRARRSSPAASGVGRIGPGVGSGLVVEDPEVRRIAVVDMEVVVVGKRSGDSLGEEPRKVVLDHARQLSICGAGEWGIGTHEIADNAT